MDTLEKSLASKFARLYKDKLKPFAGLETIESLKQKHGGQAYAEIRKAAQEAYFYGVKEVESAAQDKHPDFIAFNSSSDSDKIKKIADNWIKIFWTDVSKLMAREAGDEIKIKNEKPVELKPLDSDAAFLSLAVGVGFSAFNGAVALKMQSILPTLATGPAPPALGAPVYPITGDVTEGFEPLDDSGILELSLGLESNQAGVMFLTAEDAAVDPFICEPLNRTVYDPVEDQGLIPEPPLHKWCRCRLIPIF